MGDLLETFVSTFEFHGGRKVKISNKQKSIEFFKKIGLLRTQTGYSFSLAFIHDSPPFQSHLNFTILSLNVEEQE